MKADMLKEIAGGHWKSHPIFTVEMWKVEVAADDTRLGYWEWVENQLNTRNPVEVS